MIRRLNFTGRRRIARSRVAVRLHAAEASAPATAGPLHGGGRAGDRRGDVSDAFSIEYDLSGLDFDDDARVYVEAYNVASWMRFDFGTVGKRRDPASTALVDVTARPLPRFRLKIVDEREHVGLLLGVADRLVPLRPDEADTPEHWLLPVDFCGLGDRAWRLDLSDSPVLELNRDIEGVADAARSGGAFLGLVYPQVVREVLHHVLFVEEEDDPYSDDSAWTCLWLRFVLALPGVPAIPADSADRGAWIEDVVDVFCRTRQARERLAVTLRKEAS